MKKSNFYNSLKWVFLAFLTEFLFVLIGLTFQKSKEYIKFQIGMEDILTAFNISLN